MSQQQINTVTIAALKAWGESLTSKSFTAWLQRAKSAGHFWGADETLDEGVPV